MKHILLVVMVLVFSNFAHATFKHGCKHSHSKHHKHNKSCGYKDHKHSHHKHHFPFSKKHHGHIHKKHCGHDAPEQVVCSADERVMNGDFEDNSVTNSAGWQLISNLSGWQTSWLYHGTCNSSTPLIELQSFAYNQLPSSTQYIELDSDCLTSGPRSTNVEIKQLIPAQVGEVLKLEFDYKPRALNMGKMELTVKLGSLHIELDHFTSTAWKKYSKEYKVKSSDLQNGKILLSLKDTGHANTYGMFVDNVSVKATNCIITPKVCTAATSVVSYTPVGSIAANRKNPLQSLGLPDAEPVVEPNLKFTALGFGGQIVLKLDQPVKNIVGPDLKVWETTAGNQDYSQYQEEADVYASMDGVTWTYLGRVLNDNQDESLGEVDLGSLSEAQYIKIVDQSPIVSGRDGFDVDSVTCVNQTNDFDPEFYYVDNSTQKIYKGAIEGNNVFTKEVMTSPYTRSHIDRTETSLVIVEATGQKRITQVDLETETEQSAGAVSFTGSLTQVSVVNGLLVVNQAGTNRLYSKDMESNTSELMGQVMYNGLPLILNGGDMSHNLASTFYIVTQTNGGSLYRIADDNGTKIFEATLVATNLGAVTGLVESRSGDLLVSIANSTVMKLVDPYTGVTKDVNLKGDLKKQGQGGDLAGVDSL